MKLSVRVAFRYLLIAILICASLTTLIQPHTVLALAACAFYPVSPALTDLGTNEYVRISSLTGSYQSTGYNGGLYPNGSNVRPSAHENAGILLASQIQPLDASGQPSGSGKIGFVSIGMSNNSQEFSTFMTRLSNTTDGYYDAPALNKPALVLVNGAQGGGVLEYWSDPINYPSQYAQYWAGLDSRVTGSGLTSSQVQVAWVKTTEYQYYGFTQNEPSFPQDALQYQQRLENLIRITKQRFPNLKILYVSSRTRAFSYMKYLTPGTIEDFQQLNPEPYAFETGFAVKWAIEKQINGDASLNYDSAVGPVVAPYLSWGPYLWVNGQDQYQRTDGYSWSVSDVSSNDCVHPEASAKGKVADMLWNFFSSDTTTSPWFLASGSTPSPTPTPLITPTVSPTIAPSVSPTPSPTSTVTPTPTPGSGLISNWTFDTNTSWDNLNTCVGCQNIAATWDANGWHTYNGTSSYLNMGTFPYLNDRSTFTFSVWIRPNFDQTHTAMRYVFSDGSNIRLFYHNALNDWRFSMRNNLGVTKNIDTQGMIWQSNTWHMLTVTYDGASLKFYRDGQNPTSLAATGAVAPESGGTNLGNLTGLNTYTFNGNIDDVRIYTYPLTNTEVDSLYTQTLH